MDAAEIKEKSSYLMARVCHAHRNAVHAELAKIDLHVGQEMFLICLWQQDGVTLSEMADWLNVQQATVSRMLDRIECTGLVSRLKDPEDQRVTRVYLTDQGRSLLGPVAQIWQAIETQMLAGFTLEERLLFRRMLLQVYENLTD